MLWIDFFLLPRECCFSYHVSFYSSNQYQSIFDVLIILIILMFQNCFVIHNSTTNQQLVSIPCGGGHRAWDLSLTQDNLYVTYIKKRAVALYHVPLCSYQTIYEVITINALFGRHESNLQIFLK